MGGGPFAGGVAAAFAGLLMLGCGSSSDDSPGNTAAQSLSGTAFGMPFIARDILLVRSGSGQIPESQSQVRVSQLTLA